MKLLKKTQVQKLRVVSMSYLHDREWSDRYIPEIKAIVGSHLLVESPLEVDRRQATDRLKPQLHKRNLTGAGYKTLAFRLVRRTFGALTRNGGLGLYSPRIPF
jgi:hypothetical protein